MTEPRTPVDRRVLAAPAVVILLFLFLVLSLVEDLRNALFSPLEPVLHWTNAENNAGAVQAITAVLQVAATVLLLHLTRLATDTSRQVAADAQTRAEDLEKRREQRQKQATRQLVGLEVEHNLSLFRGYWSTLKSREAEKDAPKPQGKEQRRLEEGRYWAKQLVALRPPDWVHRSWEALLPMIGLALTPAEIHEINQLYSELDAFSAERIELLEPAAERPTTRVTYDVWNKPSDQTDYPQRFDNMAPAAWERCEELAKRILERRNPIAIEVKQATA